MKIIALITFSLGYACAAEIETTAQAIPALPEPPRVNSFVLPRLPATTQKRIDPHALIEAAAARHKVPAAVLKGIVAAESKFDSDAVSPRGAVGLMQVMPATARELGLNAHVPAENVDAGTRYLRDLLDRYRQYRDGLRRAIAAYNAGPAAVDRWQGVPPYPETQAYVARVLSLMRTFRR